NRYKIAEKHNIKFPTTEITLTDRDHAKLWILNHQLGRRNLPIGVRTALVSDVARVEEEIRRKEQTTKAGQASQKSQQVVGNKGSNAAVKKTATLNPKKSMTYEAAAKISASRWKQRVEHGGQKDPHAQPNEIKNLRSRRKTWGE